jgi:hypothetical protein
MPQYRKRPIVIEATQWFPGAKIEGVVMKSGPGYSVNGHGGPHVFVPVIETLEGDMRVSEGDFVITGVKGEIYPCKEEIFNLTYEPVEDVPKS